MTDPLQDPGVQGLAQLGRNAIERVAQLEAELAGYVEANRHMKGELDDAIDDARKYCEARREIARLRKALENVCAANAGPRDNDGAAEWHAYWRELAVTRCAIARAALAQVAEVGNG